MEQLLEMAARAADQAEVYGCDQATDSVIFQDAKLHDIETNFLSGVSLRIVKGGRLGFAYTRNLADRRELLDNALRSLEGGVEADYELPSTKETKPLDTYDPSVKYLAGAELIAEAGRICDNLQAKTGGEIMAVCYTYRDRLRIMNSRGTDVSRQGSGGGTFCEVFYPGSGSGFGGSHQAKGMSRMPEPQLVEIADLYNKGLKTVEPRGGRMKVLFMPNSMIVLLWRLAAGLSGRSVYEKISPVADRLGQAMFSPKLTLIDDALDDRFPGARAFDDEGVACAPLTLVGEGRLQAFFFDLKYGQKMGARSTGHGYRSGQWGGDPVTIKPGPDLTHLFIKPGSASLEKLIGMMDRGIIVEGALGAHSGNIPNGDYSVGVSPGLYVENGQVVGRIKDAMVAGNIYETLRNVVELGDALSPSWGGAWVPPILCDGVSVATKGHGSG